MAISTIELRQITEVWPRMAGTLRAPRTDKEYGELLEAMDQLMKKVGGDEEHPLMSLMEVMAVLIGSYEDENVAEVKG
jgi:HTH-type transcriptional regulator/antitoxin HigA